MAAKDDLGRRGEDLAAQFLRDAGCEVLERNWRCPLGELDLVVRHGSELVFVEVKTRSSTAFGHPLEAITPAKLARLRLLAGAWCEAHPGPRRPIRLDAIGIVAGATGAARIEHVRGLG